VETLAGLIYWNSQSFENLSIPWHIYVWKAKLFNTIAEKDAHFIYNVALRMIDFGLIWTLVSRLKTFGWIRALKCSRRDNPDGHSGCLKRRMNSGAQRSRVGSNMMCFGDMAQIGRGHGFMQQSSATLWASWGASQPLLCDFVSGLKYVGISFSVKYPANNGCGEQLWI
jgi:hypothetical protein